VNSEVVEKIVKKASKLPLDAQRNLLSYVESLEREEALSRKPFRSVLGIFADRNVNITEEDVSDMRREIHRPRL
jgi:hypothetical protein